MIQLTENAAGKVKDLLVEEGRSDVALRVAVQPGGPHGRLPYVIADLKHADGLVGAVTLEGQEVTVSNMNGEVGA